jgi:uncharacterized protein (DUF1499 family)
MAVVALGPLGWRIGWWHYGVAFETLMPWAGYVGIAAMIVSVLAVVAVLMGRQRGRLVLALASLAAGAVAVYMPWQANSLRGVYPRINDITTDTDNPPAFVAAFALRKADGGNDGKYSAETAAVQKRSYADIAPLTSKLAPAEAFVRAADTAATMPGWRVTDRDTAAGRIEASQASRWFGFTDDIVIRVTADGTGSRIDVRSASRHGRGDFGINAARVRTYLIALGSRLK